jgi:hypothetical protein
MNAETYSKCCVFLNTRPIIPLKPQEKGEECSEVEQKPFSR